MKTSVMEYIDLLYERLGKLAIEEIEYSDYDEMTDWLAEIRKEVKRLEKRDTPMKPTPYKKTIAICKSCEDFVDRWDNYCPNCGQKIDWSEE